MDGYRPDPEPPIALPPPPELAKVLIMPAAEGRASEKPRETVGPRNPGTGEPGDRGTAGPGDQDAAEWLPEPLDQPIKFRVSRTEASELRRIAGEFGDQLHTTLDIANVGRAFLLLLRNAEHEIKQQARRNGPLKRPRNDNMAALAEFDQRIAQLLGDALRKAPPLR